VPAAQVAVAFVGAWQTLLQPPQFCRSVAVLTHWSPHLVKGALHSKPHTPPTQVVVALVTLGHCTPQAPQLLVSVLVFVSQPLAALLSQFAKGALHTKPQVPAAQVAVAFVGAWQTLLQPPQFCRSVAVLTHWSPHLVKGALHSKPHWPLLQTGCALVTSVVQTLQSWPPPPQA
jgi:hypothetical protein